MDKTANIKNQRDRFLAFSFASADLFLEVNEQGVVDFALGAAQSLTGINDKSLIGQRWLDIFSNQDRPTLMKMQGKARDAERCGPFLVTLDQTLGNGQRAILTAIKMPGKDRLYITLGFSNAMMVQLSGEMMARDEYELLDKDNFLLAAKDAIDVARTSGKDLDMTLLDIENISEIKDKMGEDWWGTFRGAITDLLCSYSADGQAAAEIDIGRYSIIHDKSVTMDSLLSQLTALAQEQAPNEEGFEIKGKTVQADIQSLSERETSKALVYTINEFERKGTGLNIETLNSGFKAYVTANAHKIQQFKTMVEQLSFDFHYQPIVDIESLEVSHYEMLARFKDQGSTQEWVIFGEDIGMAADLDIAVCERAINYLLYKSQGRNTKFAVNLSGQSVQNEQFFKTLLAKLDLNKHLAKRIIFEITESTEIKELDMVNNFIQVLQERGFKVCLDDFGAGAASFQYLQKLHVDYLKIDGQYTRKLLTSQRDAVMVRNLARMCQDLGITAIAEVVENIEQARMIREMGIPLAQGFLYSKPLLKPDFEPSEARKLIPPL